MFRSVFFVVEPNGGQLRELATLIDGQQLRPVVSAVFELSALPEAFQAQRSARPPGKVIITVEQPAGERRPPGGFMIVGSFGPDGARNCS